MKKFLISFLIFFISSISANAFDIKFIQVDSVKYSPNVETSTENFDNLINEINKEKNVSFVVFTGDNLAKSNKVSLESFLKKANKLNIPYYIALGHKDLNKRNGLSQNAYMKLAHKYNKNISETSNYTFKKKNVLFIVANGAKEFIPTPFGYYREDVIKWVDEILTKNKNKNVVILQHFPIYPPAENEVFYTYKASDYMDVINNHQNVKAVVSGFKINAENDINGVKHITTAEFPQYRIIEIIDSETVNPTIWSTLK